MTEEGKARLKEGGMEGAYLGPDGYVHIPGKRVTLYSEPSPTKEEMEQVWMFCVQLIYQSHTSRKGSVAPIYRTVIQIMFTIK